jgi:hypothetical protein
MHFAADADWDVDFYQCCFHTTYTYLAERRIDRDHERYDDADRGRMVEFIRQAPHPCMAFKVLAANRKCATPDETAAALRFAYKSIKPTDVVCVGMWNKHTDQVGANARTVREILTP